jgi:hypothetical protein
MNPDLEYLNGRAGCVGVAIRPSPVRGDLTAIAITRPVELCLRHRGVEFTESGAYVNNGVLFCQFTTADLGTALPALRAYFNEIGFRNFARVGYQLSNRHEWQDFDPEDRGSYCAIDRWTWRDRLRLRWGKITGSGRVRRVRNWWYCQRAIGNLHRALHVAAVGFAVVGLAAYFHDPVTTISCGLISILCAVASHLTRPMLPREDVERMFAEDMDDARARHAEFMRQVIAERKGRKDA